MLFSELHTLDFYLMWPVSWIWGFGWIFFLAEIGEVL